MDEPRMFDVPVTSRQAVQGRVARPRESAVEVREFGGWTLDKLEVLSAYLRMYRRVAGSGSYIDGFAGEGHAMINGNATMGSPLRAASSGAFRDLFLFEQHRATHAKLKGAINALSEKQRVHLHIAEPGDMNQLLPDLLASGDVSVDKPCFAFLDPDSTQLAWQTVTILSEYKTYIKPRDHERSPQRCKVELWILLNTYQALARLFPSDRTRHTAPPFAAKLDFVFGNREAWWDLWERPTSNVNSLATRYSDRLRSELGYQWVRHQLVNDPTTGRPMYHMIHASDHPAAYSLMRSAMRGRMKNETPLPFGR